MKNLIKNRCPLKRTSITAIISVLTIIGASGCVNKDVQRADTDSNAPPNITQEVTTLCPTTQVTITSTTVVSTRIQMTTTSTSTAEMDVSTTMTAMMTTAADMTNITETDVKVNYEYDNEPETISSEPYAEPVYEDQFYYNESDAVLLAQLINHESSVTWDGKVAVASCVINRCNYFGESVNNVIFAPNQFTTANSLGYYTEDDYNAAVYVLVYGTIDSRLFYFDGCHPDMKNWFYDVNYNYIGAY